ncbi:arginine repressor [Caproiciproducens sp. LBM24188]|nr:arginine repressor [Oscillospiraceae bacterium]HHV31202.1 arginine repressor [Clostridiales bacterium]
MKTRRHAKILELISQYNIDTQEELLRLLRQGGFDVTQATVSRDIKELRLVKTLSEDGKYKYSIGTDNTKDFSSKFYSLLVDSTVSINYACNLVVIKCLSGMAQAVCASMDSMHWNGVVGTLAGEDTIFVACKSEAEAENMVAELKKMIG